MKKIKLFAVITALLCVSTIITNCEKNDSTLDINKIDNEFINTLESFNINYQEKGIGQHTTTLYENKDIHGKVACSRCWGGFLDFLTVAGADIVGAGAGAFAVKEVAAGVGIATGGVGGAVVIAGGAAIAGAGASVAANRELNKPANKSNSDYKLHIENLNIVYPEDFNYLSNCGKEHNIRVYAIKNNKNVKSKTYSENDEIYNSKEWQELMTKIEEKSRIYRESGDINELLSLLKEDSLISDNSSVIFELFFNIYNKSENSHNIEDITNFYIESVANEPSLSLKDKEALIAAFSVASESPYYWANQN